MVESDELMILKAQVSQIRVSLKGCPGKCFAAPFLQNYVTLFNLYEELERELARIKAEKSWQNTVDENNESR